jgi:hypothetical protein
MAKKTKASSQKAKKAKPRPVPRKSGGRSPSGKEKHSKVRKLIALAKKMLRRK